MIVFTPAGNGIGTLPNDYLGIDNYPSYDELCIHYQLSSTTLPGDTIYHLWMYVYEDIGRQPNVDTCLGDSGGPLFCCDCVSLILPGEARNSEDQKFVVPFDVMVITTVGDGSDEKNCQGITD